MGKLILVPTPIGNLSDITLRAIDALKSADLILAEDTRKTGILLKHFSISNRLQSYHQHNEHKKTGPIADRIAAGETIALVTDAGTPSISDPGYLLVRACIERKAAVECLPGAVAFIPALVNSGLPCDRFSFEGFLPRKKGRRKQISNLLGESRTMVFYESPFRLAALLRDFAETFGPERQASVSRELTKLYEETVRGSLAELIRHFEDKTIKGEIVVIVAGNRA